MVGVGGGLWVGVEGGGGEGYVAEAECELVGVWVAEAVRVAV